MRIAIPRHPGEGRGRCGVSRTIITTPASAGVTGC